MPNHTKPEPTSLFYSYSHKDEALRDMLEKHLSLLYRQGLLSPWHDREIAAGTEWRQAVDEHLETASLLLLLISPDFLASDYCYDLEMQRALQRHNEGKARVIPIILRPCDWQNPPFSSLQALPRNGKPITTWNNQDEAFEDIALNLRALIERSPPAPRSFKSSASARLNREAMLHRLQRMYEELLADSLQEIAWIELGLSEQPGAVQNATNLILRRAMQAERPLAPHTSIIQVYQEANQELLILGAPGAGKSTLLYHLGRHLVSEASHQATHPLPILFPLSSWAESHHSLADWMVEQLCSSLYLLPRELSRQWVEQELLLPLLDGLDEMDEAARPACIAAINAYRREHIHPLVVCSRTAEYTIASAQERLMLQNAVVVQSLSLAQLDTVLVQSGKPYSGLRSELKRNADLAELATTPLWLNVLLLTFKDTSVQALPKQRSKLQQRLFQLYVGRMVERKGKATRTQKHYPLNNTLRWLSWLARHMRKQNQTVFAVEMLQPDWMDRRLHISYRWSVGLLYGLVFGLVGGLVFGLLYGLVFVLLFGVLYGLAVWLPEGSLKALVFVLVGGLIFGLVFGLVGGLVFGLVFGLLGGLFFGLLYGPLSGLAVGLLGWQANRLAERITWSWKQALSGLLYGLVFGLVGGLVFGLFFGPLSGLFFGLVVGLLSGLLLGLVPTQYIDRRALSPGEGLRRSARNGLFLGLFYGLVYGLVGGLFFGLFFGLVGGLFSGLAFGLGPVAEHFLLRFWLWRAGHLPFHPGPFLEDARARHLLQRVGGSYRFVHRLLLDYFADLDGGVTPATDTTVLASGDKHEP